MKKSFTILPTFLVIFTVLLCLLTSCKSTCDHSYIDIEVIESNCTVHKILRQCEKCNETITFTEAPVNKRAHVYSDGICTLCNKAQYSSGLSYKILENGTYAVTGIGDCRDTDIGIPPVYEGLPVTSIGAEAFRASADLTSVSIPESITSIGPHAFYACTSIEEIYFNATAMNDLRSSNYVFYNAGKDSDGIKVIIGTSVKKIPAYLFYPSSNSSTCAPNVTSIEFEAGSVCESIGEWALRECVNLTSVAIPNSITNIGDNAFYGCESITEVHISDIAAWCGISFATSFSNPLCYAHNLFVNGELVTELVIPSGVTSVGSYAFRDCACIVSVQIPSSVTSIGNKAFELCHKLVEVVNRSSLGIAAGSESNGYVGCYAKQIHTGDSKIVNYNDYLFITSGGVSYLLGYVGDSKLLSLPKSYNGESYEIYQYAFYGRKNITGVTIPDCITAIGDFAFMDCTALEKINFDAIAMKDLTASSGLFYNAGKNGGGIKVVFGKNVTKVPAYLFYSPILTSYSPKITTVEFAEGSVCESIGMSAFFECDDIRYNEYDNAYYFGNRSNPYLMLFKAKETSIASVTIHNDTKVICSKAFAECRSITSVTIPGNVTVIDAMAFSGCHGLTSVTLRDGVINIGESAFENCRGLVSVTISKSVTEIGNGAFSGCVSLTVIEVDPENSEYKDIDGNLYSKDGKVLIQYAIGKASTEFVIPNGVISIGRCAFGYCKNLISVTIPSSITSIGDSAFEGCTSLASVTFPSGFTDIGNYAFAYCGISSITFAGTVGEWNAIPKGSDWNKDTNVTEVICSNGVVSIA